MKEKTYIQHLDTKHPWHTQRQAAIGSLNHLSDRIRENKDNMYSKIYFAVSLILTTFIAIFAESLNWAVVLFLADLLLVLLIIYARGYYKKRKGYAANKKEIRKSFEELGLELKE